MPPKATRKTPPTSPTHTSKSVKLQVQLKPPSQVGDVFVIGSGDCGQLGLGPEIFDKERPAILNYFKDKQIVAIYAGGLHNLALSLDGKLYSWGCNDQKALGRGGEETEPGPVDGLEGQKIVAAACGDSISAALTEHGAVYAWGTFRDKTGIFGFSASVKIQEIPSLLPLKNIIQISAGTNHLVALSKEGRVYSWGVGEQGQLGRRIMGRHILDASLTPRQINLKETFTGAFCGGYHTFFVTAEKVFSCGLNNYGQLGLGHQNEVGSPEEIQGLSSIKAMTGGEHHTLALGKDVFVFGRGDSGQLGIFATPHGSDPKLTPTKLPMTHTIKLSAGGAFSLSLNSQGQVYAWGYGEMGQLANGSQDSPHPFQIDLKNRFVLDIAAGGQHTVLLLKPKE